MRLWILLMITWLLCPATYGISGTSEKCVRVYYDKSTQKNYTLGRTYSIFLQNLLGHFPEYQQIVSPIEYYKSGDIENCTATIYLGSYFENNIPKEFIDDYLVTKKNVAWVGHSIWKLGQEKLENLFGYRYDSLTKLNTEVLDVNGLPTYFKNILYRGETFSKYGGYDSGNPKIFSAPFEMTALKKTHDGVSQVIAEAQHNGTGQILPYIIRNQNHFFVSEVPFSFIHESDRYFVFADLLFDILNEQPRHKEHYAVVRLEDVHALTPLPLLDEMVKVLNDNQIPIHISLIPIFFDPLNLYGRKAKTPERVPINENTQFMKFVNELRKKDAVFIWHGVTHQLDRTKNPFNGVSGSDFEFWDANSKMPLSNDSPALVIHRLEDGMQTLKLANLSPTIWVTPHYQASALDYYIFGRAFSWNMGRVIYFDHSVHGLPPSNGDGSDLWIANSGLDPHLTKLKVHFEQTKITYNSEKWDGQIFPYEIYGDIYGQRLIPENLGDCQPNMNQYIVGVRTVQDILNDAKRNLVLRDSWASFFYHPFLMGVGADPKEFKLLVTGIKKLGYEFINLEKLTKKIGDPMRREPIYLTPKKVPAT